MDKVFAWESDSEFYDNQYDKCLGNTDHTTGNNYLRLHDDFPNQNDFQMNFHQQEERMIHCDDDRNCLQDQQNEALVQEYLDDQEEKEVKTQTFQINNQNLQAKEEPKNVVIVQNLSQKVCEQLPDISKETQVKLQNGSDYKLTRKWNQKMNNVLQQKSIHQFSAKHNRNMAKFFVRIFSKYIKQNSDKYQFSPKIVQNLQEILEKNCISLKDLQSLFGGQGSRASRQFLSKILRTKLKQEVIKSQDVQNKAAYLLCSKVYALRCRSRHLIGRLQSR